MKKETKKAEFKDVIVEGKVVSAYYGTTKYDDNKKYRLSIYSEVIDYTEFTAFDNSGAKLTPAWFKEQKGYINLSSLFDIPVMNTDGEEMTTKEWLDTKKAVHSFIKLKVRQKEGAVYPAAIIVVEDGEEADPFAGM
jgi:hypothetical protein